MLSSNEFSTFLPSYDQMVTGVGKGAIPSFIDRLYLFLDYLLGMFV